MHNFGRNSPLWGGTGVQDGEGAAFDDFILFFVVECGVSSNAARQIFKRNAGEKVLFYPPISKVLLKTVKEEIYLFTGWTRWHCVSCSCSDCCWNTWWWSPFLCYQASHSYFGSFLKRWMWGAIIRGRGTCSTCQSFDLTYHERTTFIDLNRLNRPRYVHVPEQTEQT